MANLVAFNRKDIRSFPPYERVGSRSENIKMCSEYGWIRHFCPTGYGSSNSEILIIFDFTKYSDADPDPNFHVHVDLCRSGSGLASKQCRSSNFWLVTVLPLNNVSLQCQMCYIFFSTSILDSI